ncbi:MAG TPA: hypothetical protein VGR28_14845 [Candidatus Thermoplasmatota archaeon]|jgi:hypothetical protein|nr:hypothetical protein [Candidatus Thermoplasmatota archaeon]
MRASLALPAALLLGGCTIPGAGPTVFLFAEESIVAAVPEGQVLGLDAPHCANPQYGLAPPSLEFIDYTVDNETPDARPAGVFVLHPSTNITGGGRATVVGADARAVMLAAAWVNISVAAPGGPRALQVRLQGDDVEIGKMSFGGDTVLVDVVTLHPGERASHEMSFSVARGHHTVAVHDTFAINHLGRVTPTIRTAVGCA